MSEKRLIAFDVDGTLVRSRNQQVVWELFNRHYCTPAVDGDRFSAFRQRHITYAEWVALDVLDWLIAGATRDEMSRLVQDNLSLVPGATQTLEELARQQQRLVVISGTLDITLQVLLPGDPFEEVHTNQLFFGPCGRLTGWRATRYDMQGKALALERIAQRMDIPLAQTVFVGDNVNDVYAMDRAGLAIAFEPKAPEVARAADHVVTGSLQGLLPLILQRSQ